MDKYGKALSSIFLSLLLIITALGLTPRVYADASHNVLELSPAYVDVSLGKDDVQKSIELTFTNKSTKPISLELFPIDFKQADDTGVYGFLGQDAGSYSYSLASFLSFETNRLDLDPGQKHIFTVVVKNRQDLSPGGHYAAVVARQISDAEPSSAATIAPAVSSMIFLEKKGGERYNLSLKSLDWPRFPVVFSYPGQVMLTFQNEGNVHVMPYGRVAIKDMFGRVLAVGSINESSLRVLPETRRIIPVLIRRLAASFPISFNIIEVNGYDSSKNTNFTYSDSFVYIHPLFLVAVFALIIAVFFLVRYKRRQKKA